MRLNTGFDLNLCKPQRSGIRWLKNVREIYKIPAFSIEVIKNIFMRNSKHPPMFTKSFEQGVITLMDFWGFNIVVSQGWNSFLLSSTNWQIPLTMLWTLEINFELLRIKRKLSFYVAAEMKYEKISCKISYSLALFRSAKKSRAIFLQIICKGRFSMTKCRCALRAVVLWSQDNSNLTLEHDCRLPKHSCKLFAQWWRILIFSEHSIDWGRRTTQYFETVVVKYFSWVTARGKLDSISDIIFFMSQQLGARGDIISGNEINRNDNKHLNSMLHFTIVVSS